MRVGVLTLLAALLLPLPASAQQAWVRAYREGVAAFEDGNYALAEQKLKEARDDRLAPREQSRRANFSGMFFEPFIPDYYLGIIAARRGRHAEAVRLLEGALAKGLITESQREEYKLAMTHLSRARDEVARLARARDTRPGAGSATSARPAPSGSSAGGNTSTTREGAGSTAEPAWRAGFLKSMEAARNALEQRRFASARSNAASAAAAAGDAASRQQAEQLRRQIESTQESQEKRIAGLIRDALRSRNARRAQTELSNLAALNPEHPGLRGFRSEIERLQRTLGMDASIARTERTAIRLFLAGDYEKSAAELQRAVSSGMSSPRIYLYLACSQAALALLAGPSQNEALVQEARRHYTLARPSQNAFATDRRFISPRILELLDGG